MVKRKQRYLTIEEKRELALQGKSVPICINESQDNNRDIFIVKMRSIYNGALKNKTLKI